MTINWEATAPSRANISLPLAAHKISEPTTTTTTTCPSRLNTIHSTQTHSALPTIDLLVVIFIYTSLGHNKGDVGDNSGDGCECTS